MSESFAGSLDGCKLVAQCKAGWPAGGACVNEHQTKQLGAGLDCIAVCLCRSAAVGASSAGVTGQGQDKLHLKALKRISTAFSQPQKLEWIR